MNKKKTIFFVFFLQNDVFPRLAQKTKVFIGVIKKTFYISSVN